MRIITAFDLDFASWPPSSPPVRHGIAAPLGSIRLAYAGKSQHREIKVQMQGPPQKRWMNLARFWWLKYKGPVPAGKRVAHVDGDTLNDDPQNYALFTPGDVITGYHIDNPEWSKRQHERKRRGAIEANKQRGAIERRRRLYLDHWYAVDLDGRRIFMLPQREQWQVYAALGCRVQRAKNGRGYGGGVFGWPGIETLGAAILSALMNGEADSRTLFDDVLSLLRRQRLRVPQFRASMAAALVPLRKAGLVTSTRRGKRLAVHRITEAATASRGGSSPFVAIKGEELATREFRLFDRIGVEDLSSALAQPMREAS